ncbi:MAG: hypothetical protein M1824_001744 [Vezdaea acicularis]|nr:MAG: hypothetical protein M1824_001744 [Vezdaea acicularis]
MAPQTSIPTSANVLGTIGTVLWCIQLVPQIIQNYRTKDTTGLPLLMLTLWAICAPPFGVYNIVQNFNLPLQIQPQIFGFVCLITWAQVLIYSHKWPTWKAVVAVIAMVVCFAGFQLLFVFTLRGPYARGVEYPVTIVGVAAGIILAVGLIPPYFELSKRRGRVVGINFVFLTMDWLGAFFSFMAVVAQTHFDILGGTLYLLVIILEMGLFFSHGVWLYRTRKIRRLAKAMGKSVEQLESEGAATPGDVERGTVRSRGSSTLTVNSSAEVERTPTIPEEAHVSGSAGTVEKDGTLPGTEKAIEI